MKRLFHNRNGTEVFALRTQKNLEHIAKAAMSGEDVHPVTQAITSLLGVVVFPWIGTITGEQLIEFSRCFSSAIQGEVG